MTESVRREVIQPIIDTTDKIRQAVLEDAWDQYAIQAEALKRLAAAISGFRIPTTPVSRVLLASLKDRLEQTMEAVSQKMAANRKRMAATGIKKKLLSAYGTVTLASKLEA